ncbi:tetratricopeptide repeat protein [Streptosporangium lutulentum]
MTTNGLTGCNRTACTWPRSSGCGRRSQGGWPGSAGSRCSAATTSGRGGSASGRRGWPPSRATGPDRSSPRWDSPSPRARTALDLAETHLRNLLEQAPWQDTGEVPPPHLPMIMTELGLVTERRGDVEAALALHLRAVDLATRFDSAREMTGALEGLAGVLVLTGDPARAALLLGAAAAARVSSGLPLTPAERGDIDRIAASARDALGEKGFAVEFEHGGGLTIEGVRSVVVR